jgi:membrane protease YdiL (CAAX protease family)
MMSPQPVEEHLTSPLKALVDLIVFLAVMFFIRTIYFPGIGFWGNVLANSIATIGIATLLLYYRGQSWKNMGLVKPKKLLMVLVIAAATFVATIGAIMFFEIFLRDLLFPVVISDLATAAPTQAEPDPGSRFPDMKGRFGLFAGVIIIVWIESFFEELQDRGFTLNRFEALLSKVPFSIVLAVIIQAAIFGFRHSSTHGISGSVVVGIIGLVFGIVYVVSGRNLWPLIIAHSLINTIDMMDKL